MPLPILPRLPAPLTPPLRLSVKPGSLLKVPPPAPSVTVRLVATFALAHSVPPPRLRPPAALPRLPSLVTITEPPLMVVPPA